MKIESEQQRYNALHASLMRDGTLMHVQELLERAARTWPHNTMIICEEARITYKELYQRSLLLGHTLRTLGVKSGERVIIFYENSLEFCIAYFAVWQAGGIVAPLNVFLQEHELLKIIEDAAPKVVIVSPHLKEKLHNYPSDTLPPLISEIELKSPLSEHIEPIKQEEQDVHAVAAFLYTSGTTGFPKAVMLSSHAIVTNALQGITKFAFNSKDRVFCPLPLFHSFPQNVCLWSTVLLGATAIIVPKIERKTLIQGIAHNPTIIMAVPALYGLFCLLKTLRFRYVKLFFAGGDALSDKIRSLFALVYGRKICNGYGLTETAPFISVDSDDYTQPTNTIGKPLIGIQVQIRNEHNQKVAQGAIGTLWVKGENLMLGYYKAPEATAAVLQDGWLNTGDLAYIDENNKIVLAGRERDLISNKGLKIYPQEVENVLLSHPTVLQAAVIGKKEDEEELPIAYIASKEEDVEKLAGELRALCLRNLAAYKVPRQFIIRRELPVTTTGKVDKKILRAEMEAKGS